jgi:hypothetical protein
VSGKTFAGTPQGQNSRRTAIVQRPRVRKARIIGQTADLGRLEMQISISSASIRLCLRLGSSQGSDRHGFAGDGKAMPSARSELRVRNLVRDAKSKGARVARPIAP